MHHFSIRDVEHLSGIKAHTLRVWEQRYGLCAGKRKESQHRFYDADDLKYILRIAYLYHNGYRISRIAGMSSDEINQLALQKLTSDEHSILINQLVEACLDYSPDHFEKLLRHISDSMSIEQCIEKVIYPFFDKIGLLWITGHVLPGQEHFCTHLIEKMLISAIQALPAVHSSRYRVLLFTPTGEMHDIPLLIAQYVLRKKGVRTLVPGKNCSMDLLHDCCQQQPVTHLYFHLITNFTHCDAGVYINKLAAEFSHVQIIASGPALKEIKQLPVNVQLLRSLQEMFQLLPQEG